MLIRCKLIRDGGTAVDLGEASYHFKPDSSGAHVAEVKDKNHVGIFLSIREAYELHDDEPAAPVVEPVAKSEADDKPAKPAKQDKRGKGEAKVETAG